MGVGVTRTWVIVAGLACGLAVGACGTLPALDEATGGIPVYDIVLRTKCELSSAFEDDAGNWLPDKYKKFAWLQNWTAQTDLTLQVLDQATLAPGASLNQPLHNAYPTHVGPSSISTSGALGTTISGVSQSFAVAAGVSLNGQAQRTETLSFAFSVKELRDWRARTDTRELCAVSDNMDLRGRLGLREWLRQAVSPVVSRDELLYAGYHPKPATAASTTAKGGPTQTTKPEGVPKEFTETKCTNENLDDLKKQLNAAQNSLGEANQIAKDAKASFDSASNNENSEVEALKKAKKAIDADRAQYEAVLDPAVKKEVDENAANVNLAQEFADAAEANINAARKKFNALTTVKGLITTTGLAIDAAKGDLQKCDFAGLQKRVNAATAGAADALFNINTVVTDIAAANENIKSMKKYIDTATEFTSKAIDPPIATIGQSVQFILVYGGNITPTWTFVRFKGPNSPLFSATGTRTHTLIITLGPINSATNAPNTDVKQNQFYLQLNSVLSPQIP
jgi:hypothetical protein